MKVISIQFVLDTCQCEKGSSELFSVFNGFVGKRKDTIETDRPLSSENNIYLDKDTANYACWENVLYSRLKNTVVTD